MGRRPMSEVRVRPAATALNEAAWKGAASAPPGGEAAARERAAALEEAVAAMKAEIRGRLARIADPVLLFGGLPQVAVFVAVGVSRDGWSVLSVVYVALGVMGAVLATLGRRMEAERRGRWYAAWLYAFAAAALCYFGPLLGTGGLFVTATVGAGVFTGRRGVGVAVLGLVPALWLGSAIAPLQLDLAGWLRTGVSLAGAMAVSGLFVVYLITKMAGAHGAVAVALERERAERVARERVQADLNRARRVEAVGRLASGVAHEVNNALTVVLGNAQLLKLEGTERGVGMQMLDDVIAAATAAQTTVGHLTGFEGAGTVPGAVDLGEAVADVVGRYRARVPAGVDLRVACEAGGWVALHPSQFERLLRALLDNACDAVASGGVVEVAVRSEGEAWLVLEVRDDGVGMAPEVLERAFEPFFTTKPEGLGRGLGLASVYTAAHAVGGQVDIASAPDAGTTVRVEFPRAAPPR